MTRLTCQQLSVTRDESCLVRAVDLTCDAASLTMIVGPNGAGKTTLLRALAGFEREATARVTIDGRSLESFAPSELARQVSWVPTSVAIPFAFTVKDVVVLGRFAHHGGLPRSRDFTLAEEALEIVEASHLAKRHYPTLSSGERQKVQLARALAAETPILLLDEPCASLDIRASLAVLATLRDLARRGRTIVLAHHDLTTVRSFATHVAFMKEGTLECAGRVEEAMTAAQVTATFGVAAKEHTTADGERILHF